MKAGQCVKMLRDETEIFVIREVGLSKDGVPCTAVTREGKDSVFLIHDSFWKDNEFEIVSYGKLSELEAPKLLTKSEMIQLVRAEKIRLGPLFDRIMKEISDVPLHPKTASEQDLMDLLVLCKKET